MHILFEEAKFRICIAIFEVPRLVLHFKASKERRPYKLLCSAGSKVVVAGTC